MYKVFVLLRCILFPKKAKGAFKVLGLSIARGNRHYTSLSEARHQKISF